MPDMRQNETMPLVYAMTTKSCGTCEFWDRANMDTEHGITFAWCLWAAEYQDRVASAVSSTVMDKDDGQDCPVFKQIKEEG